uniref:Peptidase S26B, signal peptidase (SEC11, sipW) n=1 Tax=uncultured marine thaumarchaeote KM3_88_C09 TaxID=1456333 RepID=A0A075HWP6_9ARCH|nr:peptidase S26B, signal peptidase (SEC11, sipW) [uncultured marine thaumarchaeote KM3_88_C09]
MTSRSIKNIIKDIVIVAVCVAVVWIALQVYFGTPNPFYVVSSGSMYPELAMYDIIVVTGHASFEDVKVGDIIVFDQPKDHKKVIVHRVVAVVDDDPKTLRTKGDNNQASIPGTDFPITEEEYIGTVVHLIPQVGYVTKILQPPVNYIIIAIIIGIMIIKQISARQKKKEDIINNFDESQSNENIDKISNDEEYSKLKDITKEEKKSAEKLNEENIPEFFLDRERESEEKKE